jgi:hypothetical protein
MLKRSFVRVALLGFLAAGIFSLIGLLVGHLTADASPTCTDSWVGTSAASGTNWVTAANWSTKKVPTSSDYVCMSASPVNDDHYRFRRHGRRGRHQLADFGNFDR